MVTPGKSQVDFREIFTKIIHSNNSNKNNNNNIIK